MQTWKQAFSLAMFEVRASWRSLPLLFFVLVFLTMVLFEIFLKSDTGLKFIYDFVFILLFGTVPAWIKPKEFQFQKLENDFWGTAYFIFLNQLAIPKEVLIKSRFINYFIIAIPLYIALFISLFIFFDSSTMFSIGQYIAFAIIWISFGIYCGALFPAGDTGEYITNLKLNIYSILLIAGTLGLLVFIRILTGNGIVHWSMEAAKHWPFLSSIISIILAIAGVKYWLHYAAKNMEKIDYFK